jgi:uncharacterized protein involved in exopolysaccharide biosynthesis
MQQAVERPSEPPSQPTTPSLWAIMRRRWWLIALLVGAAAVVALVVGLLAPATYRSSERLQVIVLDQQEVTLFTRLQSAGVIDQMSIILTDFSDILRSPLIAWRTIDDLDLAMSAQELLKNLEVSIAGEFMTISYEGGTAELTQHILSRQIENAIDYYESLRARPAQSTGQFLDIAMDQQSQVVAAAQSALEQFQLQHNVSDLTREINAGQDILRALRAEQSASLVEASRAEALATHWRQAAEDALARAEAARQQLAATAAPESSDELAEAAAQPAPPNAGQAAALEAEIAAQEALANTNRTSAINQEALATGHRAAAAEQDAIISQLTTDLAQLISLSSQYDALATALADARADYEFLRSKAVEAKLKERQINDVGYLQVVEPAYLPTAPAPSTAPRLVLLAVLVSLLLGIVLVLLLEAIQPAPRRS